MKTHPPRDPAHHPRHTARWLGALLGGALLYYAGMALHERSQRTAERWRDAAMLTGGDPARGPALLRQYGCARCHTIGGVPGADGLVGPPLTGIANRMYVGGVVTNTPDNLVRWIMNPKAIDAKTAMPAVGVTEAQARDIAAYLYTLR